MYIFRDNINKKTHNLWMITVEESEFFWSSFILSPFDQISFQLLAHLFLHHSSHIVLLERNIRGMTSQHITLTCQSELCEAVIMILDCYYWQCKGMYCNVRLEGPPWQSSENAVVFLFRDGPGILGILPYLTLYCPMMPYGVMTLWTLHKLTGFYMGLVVLGVIL